MEAGSDSIHLEIHLTATTGDGKRIAEITNAQVFPVFPTLESWQKGDQAFRQMLESQFVNPARSMVAAYMRKTTEEPFSRLDSLMPEADFALPASERKNLQALFDEITRQGA